MKKSTAAALILTFIGTVLFAISVSRVPIVMMKFSHERLGWAGGGAGLFRWTEDEGWKPMRFQGDVSGFDIAPEGVCWVIVGREAIWTTDDYGQSWDLASLEFNQDAVVKLSHVQVLTRRVGFALATSYSKPIGKFSLPIPQHSMLFVTSDGGRSWAFLAQEELIRDMSALSERTIWLLSRSRVVKTDDAGKTWQVILEAPNLERVFLHDERTGWVFGDSNAIFRTTDGGVTWSSSTVEARFGDMFFLDPKHGFAVEHNRVPPLAALPVITISLMATSDGGETWERLFTASQHREIVASFATPTKGWIATFEVRLGGPRLPFEVLRTEDGGRSWRKEFDWNEP